MIDTRLKSLLDPQQVATPSGRIVRLLSERGSLSGAQIARLTGLARSTVSIAVAELRKAGLVSQLDAPGAAVQTHPVGSRSVGRPGTSLTLNPEAGTCVGVHLGLGEVHVMMADVSHAVISEQIIALPQGYSPAVAADLLDAWIGATNAANGLMRAGLLGVGVSVSAPVATDGTVHRSSVFPEWAGVDIARSFSQILGVPVQVDNESNCSAIAEMTWGAARGQDDFVLFKLNIGVGGAVVIGGRVITGVAGGGGEFGHISLDPAGALCRCGNRGCLELKAGFGAALRELSHRHDRPVGLEDAIGLAQAGDSDAVRLIGDVAQVAGFGLAMIAAVLNPPLVLVSGALSRTGPVLLNPLTASFERHVLLKPGALPAHRRTRIELALLPLNDAVLGAVGLVLRHRRRAG